MQAIETEIQDRQQNWNNTVAMQQQLISQTPDPRLRNNMANQLMWAQFAHNSGVNNLASRHRALSRELDRLQPPQPEVAVADSSGDRQAAESNAAAPLVKQPLRTNLIRCNSWSFSPQRATNWCWAASLQTALALVGVEVSQEVIVQKCFGGLIDRPFDSAIAANALDTYWDTRSGQRVRIRATHVGRRPAPSEIVEKIDLQQPFILYCRTGPQSSHALVCYGYEQYQDDFVLKIFDPWPDNGHLRFRYSDIGGWTECVVLWMYRKR